MDGKLLNLGEKRALSGFTINRMFCIQNEKLSIMDFFFPIMSLSYDMSPICECMHESCWLVAIFVVIITSCDRSENEQGFKSWRREVGIKLMYYFFISFTSPFFDDERLILNILLYHHISSFTTRLKRSTFIINKNK